MFRDPGTKKRLLPDAFPTLFDVPNAPPRVSSARRVLQRAVSEPGPVPEPEPEPEPEPAPEPAPVNISPLETPMKKKLSRQLRMSRGRIEKMKTRLKSKNRAIRMLQKTVKESGKVEHVIESMKPFLHPDEHELVAMQMRMAERKSRVYSDDFKSFALAVYYKSPSCYRFLQSRFKLPAKSTINAWMSQMTITEGFCPNLLRLLQVRTQHLPASERVCTLMIDEISLKKSIDYDASLDQVQGLVKGQKGAYAMGALVFQVVGMKQPWKQAFSFFFIENAMDHSKLIDLVSSAMDKLSEVGLDVHALSSDMGSNFRSMLDQLGVTVDNPYITHREKKVWVFADMPHVMKCIRNCLYSHKKIWDMDGTCIASWHVLEEFYESDKKQKIRLAPKLKQAHFSMSVFGAKMKVKWATQLLSHSVAAGVQTYASFGQLGEDAEPTAQFCETLNDLFDVFNSSVKLGKTRFQAALTSDSNLIAYLDECYEWIQGWKVKNKKGKDITNHFQYINGMLSNINAVKMLVKDVESLGFQYLCTRRLCTDSVENLFAALRGRRGFETNPSCLGFSQAFRQVVAN